MKIWDSIKIELKNVRTEAPYKSDLDMQEISDLDLRNPPARRFF